MIRSMSIEDQPEITPLLVSMYNEHQKQRPFYIPQIDAYKHIQQVWEKIFDHENYFHFVYEKDNKAIAYMGMSIQYTNIDFIFPGEDLLLLDNLVVHPEYRYQGIATELVNFAKEFAKNSNFDSLDLYVLQEFSTTKEFYQKQNFEYISHYMSCKIQ